MYVTEAHCVVAVLTPMEPEGSGFDQVSVTRLTAVLSLYKSSPGSHRWGWTENRCHNFISAVQYSRS